MPVPAVGEPVDERRVTVEREDDRLVGREDRVEVAVTETVRMLAFVLQAHQVDDVDDAHCEVGEFLAQDRGSGEHLKSRNVACRSEHDIRFLARLLCSRPRPDPEAARTVSDGLLHREELRLRLLAGHHEVHVVHRAQAVVHCGEQRVRIRRQVHPDDLRLLVDDVVDEAGVLMAEAVVVLAPDVAREQVVERGHRRAPLDLAGDFEPLRMLVEHRVDDVDERLVRVQQAVPSGEQVPLEPALALVLAQHLHDAASSRQVLIDRPDLGIPLLVGVLVHVRGEPVGCRLIGPENAEVLLVVPDDVSQPGSENARRFRRGLPRRGDLDRVVAEVRKAQFATQQAAVGVRCCAHPKLAVRCQLGDLRHRSAGVVEQLLRVVRAQPVLKDARVLRGVPRVGQRHLVSAPGVLDRLAVDHGGTGPALRRAQDDHRPARPLGVARGRPGLDAGDLVQHRVERLRHPLVHQERVLAVEATGDDVGRVAIAAHEVEQLALRDPGEDRRVGDLVTVQVQDRQHHAILQRIDELVRVPARRERSGLRLAVSDHRRNEQVGVVERGAVGVTERVAELAALVDRAGRLRRGVTRDATGEGELPEQLLHAAGRLVDRRIQLGVGAVEPGVGDHSGAAMARAADVQRVLPALTDGSVEVRVNQVEARNRSPVAEQARLNVLGREGLAQQGVVEQVDLADAEVVRCPPPRVNAGQGRVVQGIGFPRHPGHASILRT